MNALVFRSVRVPLLRRNAESALWRLQVRLFPRGPGTPVAASEVIVALQLENG